MAGLHLTRTRIVEGVWEGVLTGAGIAAGTEAGAGSRSGSRSGSGSGAEAGPGIAPEIAPMVAVSHHGRPVAGAQVEPDPNEAGQFVVRVPIPVDLLSDGVQTFVISDAVSGERLASFTVVMGQPIDEDIRAEMALLREELDMLKRAFRRHCVETM